MPQYRVSLSFAQLPDVALDDFANTIIVGLTGNVGYPAPPVTVAQLGTLKQTFQDAVAAQAQGGTTATAAKNTARNALVEALRKDANYVEIACNNDLPTLLGSGFQFASTNRTQSVLDKVQIVGVDNGQTGELKVRIDPIANAKGFDGRIKSGTGEYGPSISFQNSKSIFFKGLTAGITYTLQLCAIGGSTGAGDWSDPVSHMAM
jgi:hypothetical protein